MYQFIYCTGTHISRMEIGVPDDIKSVMIRGAVDL